VKIWDEMVHKRPLAADVSWWRTMASQDIDSVLTEKRVFDPSPEFREHAHVKSMEEYDRLYKEAERDPEGFWAGIARELHWFKPWTRSRVELPFSKWFLGGQLNLSYNCLDRHAATWRKNKAAILWRASPAIRARSLTSNCCTKFPSSRMC